MVRGTSSSFKSTDTDEEEETCQERKAETISKRQEKK